MTQAKTEAFLLRSTPYGESDLVVHLLTRQYGRLSVLAKGARKSRRRFGGALDYFHLFEAVVRLGRTGLGRLLEVDLVRAFNAVRGGVDAYWAACHVLEVARMGAREGDPDEGLFGLVEASFEALDRGHDPTSLVRVFQAKALAALGYGFSTETCPACGSPWGDRPWARSGGTVVCADCAGPQAWGLSAGAIQTIRTAQHIPLGRMGTLRVSGSIDQELGPLIETALTEALGARPKSLKPHDRSQGAR
jgi:DNA repair protein RecO (recombination protein O)